MNNIEILAPCGNIESFNAAINAGADAVYLGLDRFSARGNAENFSLDGLKYAVEKSRLFGVKVYVAVNTLVFDDELTALHGYIANAADCGVDAFIVQDLGAAAIAAAISKEYGTELHASTQMTVTSIDGVRGLSELGLGFTRAVLARELCREEVRTVTREAERYGIETEVFIHGAHCVCVSGQCYMSSLFGGRSGNRGLCAQPCRLDFHDGNTPFALSMKDLSLIRHIPELRDMGVKSVKIEGRMKRPEYVAAVVDACRTARDGGNPDMDLLRDVFSHGGFTDGYYNRSRGNNGFEDMQGVRSREDVLATESALVKLKNKFKEPCKRYIIDFNVKINPEMFACTATVKSSGITVRVNGIAPEGARNRSVDRDFIAVQLSKLGGTIFEAGDITCEIQPGLSLSASTVNQLRRRVIEEMSREIVKKRS